MEAPSTAEDDFAASVLHAQVEEMKSSLEDLLDMLQRVLSRSMDYGRDNRGA